MLSHLKNLATFSLKISVDALSFKNLVAFSNILVLSHLKKPMAISLKEKFWCTLISKSGGFLKNFGLSHKKIYMMAISLKEKF